MYSQFVPTRCDMSKKAKTPKEPKPANLAVKFRYVVKIPAEFVAAVFSEANVQFMGSQKKFKKLLRENVSLANMLVILYTELRNDFHMPEADAPQQRFDFDKEAVMFNKDTQRFYLNDKLTCTDEAKIALDRLYKYLLDLNRGFFSYPTTQV